VDTITHALSGALVARATARSHPAPDSLSVGRRTFVGALATAFPDLDFVVGYLSPLSYIYQHRGITHSVLLLPLWALMLAALFAAAWRWKPGWRAYFGVCALGIAAHIAGDLITSFGTMIFAPLSDARYGIGTTFIIDLWFSGIILVGLGVALIWRQTRVPALAGVVALVGYVAFQWVLRQQAIDFGTSYARARGLHEAEASAQPRPVSPFNWTVIVTEGERYHYAHVNLVREKPPPAPTAQTSFLARLDAAYQPPAHAVWTRAERFGADARESSLAREAYAQPAFEFFRWFAAYPALLRVEPGNPHQCVWFHDLRFVTPGREATPFRYGMCREEGGRWQPYQLADAGRVAVH
jgi:inner membrane protein